MSDPGQGPPEEVRRLAADRAVARAGRDFATADALRDEIGVLGWVVRDVPDGFELTPAPPYDVAATVVALPDRSALPDATDRRATVALLVEGWPEDLRTCLDALLAHLPAGVGVLGLDLGDVDGAGHVLHDYARAHPERVEALHVEAAAGWSAARTALLRYDTAAAHVVMDVSTVFEGDALGPLLAALDDDAAVVAAGWRGVNVDLADDWRSFVDAGPGEVDAVLGYLFAVRRQAALATGGPHPKARFYRNADMEFCFALRQATGGRVVVPAAALPCRQDRHHGYHDSDPDYRDRESRKNYQRFLERFRGHTELLAPR